MKVTTRPPRNRRRIDSGDDQTVDDEEDTHVEETPAPAPLADPLSHVTPQTPQTAQTPVAAPLLTTPSLTQVAGRRREEGKGKTTVRGRVSMNVSTSGTIPPPLNTDVETVETDTPADPVSEVTPETSAPAPLAHPQTVETAAPLADRVSHVTLEMAETSSPAPLVTTPTLAQVAARRRQVFGKMSTTQGKGKTTVRGRVERVSELEVSN